MLIVPEEIKEYFAEVKQFARDNRLVEAFDRDILRLHLYGCSWEDPDRCRVVLGRDFAPYSFTMVIEMRQADGSYKMLFNGGVIFHGPHDNFGSGQAPTFSVSLDNRIGWQMHT